MPDTGEPPSLHVANPRQAEARAVAALALVEGVIYDLLAQGALQPEALRETLETLADSRLHSDDRIDAQAKGELHRMVIATYAVTTPAGLAAGTQTDEPAASA
jgi:hypothetical protein